MQITSYKR